MLPAEFRRVWAPPLRHAGTHRAAPRARAGRENKSQHTGEPRGAEGENEPARHLAKGRARGTAPSASLSSARVTVLPPKAQKSTRKGPRHPQPRRPFLPLPILLSSSPSAAALSLHLLPSLISLHPHPPPPEKSFFSPWKLRGSSRPPAPSGAAPPYVEAAVR